MLHLRQFLSELDDTLTQCSPIWCVYIWSSRIVDLGLMTSLMTSSRIIIIDIKRATSQTSLPVSFTEVLVSFNRCALLRYLHSERTMSPTGLSFIISKMEQSEALYSFNVFGMLLAILDTARMYACQRF